MTRLRTFLMLAAVGCMLASLPGCASSGGGGDPYYGRGTKHGDSFPATYGRTGYYRYGRPGRYRY